MFSCEFCNIVKPTKQAFIAHKAVCKADPKSKYQNLITSKFRGKFLRKNCKFCNKMLAINVIIRHQNRCVKNPNVAEEFKKICPICDKTFYHKEDRTTCSYACSNKFFRHGKEGGAQYKTDNYLINKSKYRDICFRYHEPKCVVCGEDKIVEVHHLDEIKSNNNPRNLIPLCPTHHQYWHSKFKHLIDNIVDKYIIEWKLKNGV